MTRTLTLRVPDELYDWLVEQAIDGYDGDLSEATRRALLNGRILDRILYGGDPQAELQLLLREVAEQSAREAYFEEVGHYPEESAS